MNLRIIVFAALILVGCKGRLEADADADRALVDRSQEPIASSLELEIDHADRGMIGVLAPEAEVVLVASGFARLERLDLDIGDRVAAGEIVAVMDVRGQRSELSSTTAAWHASQAELERLELELEQARANRADVEELEDFVSEAELREQRFAEELAAARKRSAGATLSQQRSKMQAAEQRIDEAELRAPFAGVVAHRHADPGATLGLGDPVVTLISAARLVRFAVPEASADRLVLGAAVHVKFEDAGLEFEATVSAIAPEIESGTRLLFAEAHFDQTPTLRVGAVARVRFVEP